MASSIAAGSNDPIKNCFNGIAHKLYSVQESICGLCSTDTKVYAFLILGRVLQAAALVSFAISIAGTIVVGPVALIGTILSVALGILGTYIAGSPEEVNDVLQMARPFVPGQPIGLINSGNNCWLNSSLQLLANVPGYEARLRQIPTVAQFLDSYAKAGHDYQKVANQINTHEIRQFLNRETGGQIDAGYHQEDAAQLFEYLFQGPNALYSLDQQINGGAATQRREPMIQVLLGEQQPRPNFQQLFNSYFDYHTDMGQRVQLSFQRPPNELLIQMKRFRQYTDSNGVMQFGKIDDPIDVPERLTVPNQFVRSNETANYEPDALLIHRGASQDVGHYIGYIKKGGTWWYCSDAHVYEVSARQALDELKNCYFCHWTKV